MVANKWPNRTELVRDNVIMLTRKTHLLNSLLYSLVVFTLYSTFALANHSQTCRLRELSLVLLKHSDLDFNFEVGLVCF